MRNAFLSLFAGLALLQVVAAPTQETVLARVNGEPIFDTDLARYGEGKNLSKEQALDNLILYRLAVQQAREQKLDETPEVRREVDHALYSAFLKKAADVSLQPTAADLKAYYEKNPLLRVRHLFLLERTPEQKARAERSLKEIQTALQKKVPFEKLVVKYSHDRNGVSRGEMDGRGAHNFPPTLYSQVLALKQNEISGPISFHGGIHFFQRLETKPFSAIPAAYEAYLRSRWIDERQKVVLEEKLKTLRVTAKIERTAP